MAKGSRDTFEVHLDAHELGVSQRVGTLFRHETRTDLPASFEYDHSWLESANRFMLDPRLDLYKGEQHPPEGATAFGILMDSSPDRWGRVLMERREAVRASNAKEPHEQKVRNLQELDFLLGVLDETRLGGLRFRRKGGPFLDDDKYGTPPVTQLKELAYISRRIEEPGVEKLPEYEKWLALLVAPGTSLGGARPKANFVDEEKHLWIAKFPAHDDRHDWGGWEYLVNRLAKKAGIEVPEARLEHLSERYGTFCSARFDRVPAGRRMYSSAMTLLERQDGESGGSYLDLAEFISDQGAAKQIDDDLEELFRRMLFNVLVGNRDDHLRNHGFLRLPTGWHLAPAFDMNPNRSKTEHALTLDGKTALPSIEVALAVAELFRLSESEAAAVLKAVRDAVGQWTEDAQRLALPAIEIKQMESVFQA